MFVITKNVQTAIPALAVGAGCCFCRKYAINAVLNINNLTLCLKKTWFLFLSRGKRKSEIWRRDADGRQTTIYNHGKQYLKRRTFKAILNDLGITWKEFVKLNI